MGQIEVFRDTIAKIRQDPLLNKKTQAAVSQTKLIEANTPASRKPPKYEMQIRVSEDSSLSAVQKLGNRYQRIALLNFANPIEPGGGVLRGANAQEESLCRASNLYPCLTGESAKEYYMYHRKAFRAGMPFIGTDRLLYTPGVTFFKEEVPSIWNDPSEASSVPEQIQYTPDWFEADIMTSAAPYFPRSSGLLPDDELKAIFIRRISNILEAAIEHGAEALVLGAFGCGAFHNPPMIVADAFRTVLLLPRYRNAFAEVCFAIKRTGLFCPNIEAFELKLSAFPEESFFSEEQNKRRFFE